MKKQKNKNWKYWASEGASIGITLTTSALTAYLADKVTDSDAIISGLSAIAGTVGWISGTTGIYSLLHRKEYKSGERNFRQDVKSIFKSNLEGIATTYSVRIPLQYTLQKYLNVEPAIAASISHIAGGIGGTVVRVIRNYQRKIFGNKSLEKTKTVNSISLEYSLIKSENE